MLLALLQALCGAAQPACNAPAAITPAAAAPGPAYGALSPAASSSSSSAGHARVGEGLLRLRLRGQPQLQLGVRQLRVAEAAMMLNGSAHTVDAARGAGELLLRCWDTAFGSAAAAAAQPQ